MRLDKLAEKTKTLYSVTNSAGNLISGYETARGDILDTIDLFLKQKLWGGMELKIENGKITYFKDWKCKKY